MKRPYADYDVLGKWHSPSFDETTRGVLAQRLQHVPQRRHFSIDEWQMVEAICARLMPQADRAEPIPITPWIDDMLFADRGEGFRHDDMPRSRDAWREGIAAIDAECRHRYGCRVIDLDGTRCDELLRAIQEGRIEPTLWRIPPQRFFVDVLLKTVAGIYYSHPSAWSEIGFGGPASPRGYVRLGVDQRDSWEAKEN